MTLPYELRIYNLKRNDKYELKQRLDNILYGLFLVVHIDGIIADICVLHFRIQRHEAVNLFLCAQRFFQEACEQFPAITLDINGGNLG